MGDSTGSNATLVRRIIQLENEKDELQRDVETLCIQQSGQTGSIDLLARLQARRVAGLEQELENCKAQLAHCTRENVNLQDELSEVYQIKGQFANLYNMELEKNKEVEKEVKFFQSKVAAALAERDRAIMEADKVHLREDSLKNELKELKDRFKLMENYNAEQQKYCSSLQQTLDELKSDDIISYKNSFQEELGTLRSTADNLQLQLDKECEAKGDVEGKLFASEAQLIQLKEGLATELRAIRSWHGSIKEAVNTSLQDAGNCLNTLVKMLQEVIESSKPTSVHQGDADHVKNDDALFSEDLENPNKNVESDKRMSNTNDIEEVHFADKTVVENYRSAITQDSKEAFFQAMQEKVAALLLLSQEEERHHLKEKMVKGLEEQISQLNQKLSQVTREKVTALMEVAQLRQDVQRLQDEERQLVQLLQQHRSTSVSGRLLPATWTESSKATQNQITQDSDGSQRKLKPSLEGVLKRSWWTGSYTAGPKITGSENSSKPSGNKKDEAIENARLRIENAALQEHVTNLQQLTRSIHRLAVTLAQVFNGSSDEQAEVSLRAALEVVDGVASEAQHLKVALSCSLPLSWCGENSTEINRLAAEETRSVDTEATKTLIDVPAAGMSMVELLLITCKIHKATLESKLRAMLLVGQGEQFAIVR
ncbi:hypothetical protein O6H91_14G045300 [Diphasiastrum complanatum]|uniref:Uncharacterized protein n=1 Tax=Diphasiastrum complanatum TaxID=34168 RepID=A0ACC2BP68_DIPCM|nr:hypothetical protein O6H91_14G045300 [Diphasiastrum complanatum]